MTKDQNIIANKQARELCVHFGVALKEINDGWIDDDNETKAKISHLILIAYDEQTSQPTVAGQPDPIIATIKNPDKPDSGYMTIDIFKINDIKVAIHVAMPDAMFWLKKDEVELLRIANERLTDEA